MNYSTDLFNPLEKSILCIKSDCAVLQNKWTYFRTYPVVCERLFLRNRFSTYVVVPGSWVTHIRRKCVIPRNLLISGFCESVISSGLEASYLSLLANLLKWVNIASCRSDTSVSPFCWRQPLLEKHPFTLIFPSPIHFFICLPLLPLNHRLSACESSLLHL